MLIDNSNEITEGLDVITQEGWNAFVQEQLDWSHNRAKEQEVRRHVILVCQVDPQTQKRLTKPLLLILFPFLSGDDISPEQEDFEKDSFTSFCKATALLGRAIACINLSEAWVSTGVGKESLNDPNRPRPKDDPNRLEALIALTEHRDFGSNMHTAFITQDKGQRVLGDWEQQDCDLQGRMTGLVPPLELYDKPSIKMILDLARKMLGSEEVKWAH